MDWKRSVFIPIPKKGNAKECSNYHTIALISHASKVMLKILQARFQQYVIPALYLPLIWMWISCLWMSYWVWVCSQSCLTLCDPMYCSLLGYSVHGTSQARILEWVAISHSKGSSYPEIEPVFSCIGRQILYQSATWEALA